MDFLPQIVDGALVFNLKNSCSIKSLTCESCLESVIYFHNWIKHSQIEYVIFDFLDEKDICIGFLEEIQQLKKRLSVIPFLFVGLSYKSQVALLKFQEQQNIKYPDFLTPEDAVRALRIQQPGLTESSLKCSVQENTPILKSFKDQWFLISGVPSGALQNVNI